MARPAPAPLVAFIYSRLPCWKADLFTVTQVDGTIFRWTDFDQPLTLSSNTFSNEGPLLQRTQLGVKHTTEVPELQIELAALDSDFINGISIKKSLHDGGFDGATLQMDRTFMPSPGDTSLGSVLLFSGRMSEIKVTAVGAQLTVKGANVLMNQYAPRNLYQTNCQHAFCDPGCTLSAAAFTLTGQVVGAGATVTQIPWSGAPVDANQYTLGVMTFNSGVCDGQQRTVKLVSAGVILPVYPFYEVPSPGDTFSILRGCDKTFNTSSGQDCTHYSNTQNWRGFDQIPPAEMAI